MTTKIDTLVNQIGEVASKGEWSAALVRVLGDGSEWEWDGKDPADGGSNSQEKCSCGHPIRWIFLIRHRVTGRTARIGSTCINYFQTVNPETHAALVGAYETLAARLAEAQKKTKEAENARKVQEAREEYLRVRRAAQERYEALRRTRSAPRPLWEVCDSWKWSLPTDPKLKYVRASDHIKWYEKHTAQLCAAMQA